MGHHVAVFTQCGNPAKLLFILTAARRKTKFGQLFFQLIGIEVNLAINAIHHTVFKPHCCFPLVRKPDMIGEDAENVLPRMQKKRHIFQLLLCFA
ncbi:Uncharacterised protein [Vibrio cholerae]|uniref:Uncharacterized protein n=1 Tax=Vibrio cholerae TaxID=666 RepID=A0A655VCG0_VIBCL|nr:Uncharacterised protein [Vibrio cholerae]CSB66002.1 Uncharacterised protein [Vibrio cholerae]CSC49904.1 Uncharacterised protein [Vibrio cholerae]